MAYFRKVKGGWRAEVAIRGVRASTTEPTKAAAVSWAAAEETAIRAGQRGNFPRRTLTEALTKYEAEVSSKKRGKDFEAKRFTALRRDFPALCATVLHEVSTGDLAAWRDKRLETVTKGTVQREINLLRNVWTIAADEWKWCESPGPWKGLRYPGHNQPRDRRAGWREIKLIVRWAGYRSGQAPHTKTCETAWAFMLGLRSALRASEMMGLTVDDVDLRQRVVLLRNHKTLEIVGMRRVPLPRPAARLLSALVAAAKTAGRPELFTLTPKQLDANWRRLLGMVGVEGLHFHDSRAEALTMLARKVDVMTLARISGHRNLKTLMDAYYRERPEEIAARL